MKTVRAFAPASIGNFAAGFDLMGAALAPLDGTLLGDIVEVAPAEASSFHLAGPWAEAVPGRDNLAQVTVDLFRGALRAKGLPCPDVALRLEKGLPVKSGLGSSAASIVATLIALQAACGEPLSRGELLTLAGRAECPDADSLHLDNVAPGLFGGLQLLVPGRPGGPAMLSRALPWPQDLVLAVVHPRLAVATAEARAILPRSVSLGDALGFAQNLAGFVHALHARDRALLARCLRDPLAEPHRAGLVPGFREAQAAALGEGALGCSLSGSGPATFAVLEGEARGRAALEAMVAAFGRVGLACEAWLCGLDTEGARVLR